MGGMTPAEVLTEAGRRIRSDAQKDLERAANLIRERGWVQGCYTTDDGAMCASTAIYLATGSTSIHTALQSVQRKLLARGWQRGLIAWNDVDGRTKDEVLALLEI